MPSSTHIPRVCLPLRLLGMLPHHRSQKWSEVLEEAKFFANSDKEVASQGSSSRKNPHDAG